MGKPKEPARPEEPRLLTELVDGFRNGLMDCFRVMCASAVDPEHSKYMTFLIERGYVEEKVDLSSNCSVPPGSEHIFGPTSKGEKLAREVEEYKSRLREYEEG